MRASFSVRAHDKEINAVTISPNDALIASASQDNSVRLWKAVDLAPIATLVGHKRGVWKVAFSPVDRSLASASGDRTVRLWSLNDFSCIRTFQGHTASVLSVRYVNHGAQLISAASDGLINLWTIATGASECVLDKHQDKVWALSILNESAFLSGGSDSKLILWEDNTEAVDNQRLLAAESDLLLQQALSNDIRNKNFERVSLFGRFFVRYFVLIFGSFSKALKSAIMMGHSSKVVVVFAGIMDNDILGEERTPAEFALRLFSLDYYVANLDDFCIEKLLGFIVEWNTNSRYSFLSQAVLNSLFRTIKVERLQACRSFDDFLPGLLSYSERHFSRIDRLHEASYVVDFISGQMGVIDNQHD